MIGMWATIEGENEDEINFKRAEKQREIAEKKKREKEIMRAIIQRGDTLSTMKDRIPSVMEQHRMIKSGQIIGDDIIGNNEITSGTIMDASYKSDEEKKKEDEYNTSSTEMYTLDPKEIKTFATKEEEERFEKDLYNKNPKDIDYTTNVQTTEQQLKRRIEVESIKDSDIDDLKWFMSHRI